MPSIEFEAFVKRTVRFWLVACAALAPLTVGAQTTAPAVAANGANELATRPLVYDVVSIRENTSTGKGGSARSTPDGDIWINQPLWGLIGPSYGVEPDHVSGLPDWVRTKNFDMQFKVAEQDIPAYGKLKHEQTQRMMQLVLEDRLKLKAHVVMKEEPVYQLVVAKGGPKLQEAKAGDKYANGLKGAGGKPIGGFGAAMGRGFFTGQKVAVGTLLNSLHGATGRPVVDKTGLTGRYDISLHWDPELSVSGDEAPSGQSEPSIFTALDEQLGLKLEPAKAEQKTLVVDHIELPTEN